MLNNFLKNLIKNFLVVTFFFTLAIWSADFAAGLTEAEGQREGGGLPQFNYTTFPSQLFWLVITFGVFYWIMHRNFAPKIDEVQVKRSNLQKKNIEQAEQIFKAAKIAEEKLEQDLITAKNAAKQSAIDNNKKIEVEYQEAMAQFRKTADVSLADNQKRLLKLQQRLNQEKSELVTTTATRILQKLLYNH